MMKHINSANADRSEGIAVIAVLEVDKTCLLGFPLLLPVLKSHLQGNLAGCGPVVGVKNPTESCGSDLNEASGQLNGRCMSEAKQGGVPDQGQLVTDGLINLLLLVAMDIGPEAGHSVNIPPAIRILQVNPFTPLHNQRVFPDPILHLRKRVPQVLLVPCLEEGGSARR